MIGRILTSLEISFKKESQFEYGSVLCNIANGVHAQATVNVDDAEFVSNNIIFSTGG